MANSESFRWPLILVAGLFSLSAQAAELLADREVTIHSAEAVAEKRGALIQYLWGAEGFPEQRLPALVITNVASPVRHLEQLERVDELRMNLAPGLEALAYHFVPQHPNLELVVVHYGPGCPDPITEY